ncbi:glycosyltransferase family A protein [Devosia sp. YIM 151766]|uniref:glycosyltransferase family 2 protein n=1 Tax=Devosia sp. YIM 151766 TaxID=3017325 RepID=UPI00255C3EA6|nr:glycosyltransferase family A protein [Devosia sp. YIM 151766]WIY53076.1 glycosyltransferase family A protein [Devosia sp. YIM 151766]
MVETVAIITPAYKARDTLPDTVRSVLGQSHKDWQHWIIADDGFDYRGLLEERGLADPRQVFLTSGGIGQGASRTRNVALERIATPYAAILDADDRLKPPKLERAVAALGRYGIVTTALDVMTTDFTHLRHVGTGPDRVLTPGEHKWVNLSMDSMIVWDRRRGDGRYDPDMSNMTDLEFLLQLYRTIPQSYHLGTPLHDYVKREGSMSNGREVAAGMIASKTEILRRLENGHYRLAEAEAAGIAAFLRISLAAETAYSAALAARPGLLFEDHLEARLIA